MKYRIIESWDGKFYPEQNVGLETDLWLYIIISRHNGSPACFETLEQAITFLNRFINGEKIHEYDIHH